MLLRNSIAVLLALVHAGPAQAQTARTGSWRAEIQRLREAFMARSLRDVLRPIRPAAARDPILVAESEPNDSTATADRARLGERATGVLNPAGDIDTWAVDLNEGQFFSVDVDAAQFGSTLDPTLALIAPDGTTLLGFNDDFDGLDSRISFRVRTSGRYFVRIRAFAGGGSPAFRYALNFGLVGCNVVGTEREPNDSPAAATPLLLGTSGSGEICPRDDNPAGDVDYWAFTAPAGAAIELDVDVVEFGILGDPVLTVYSTDGTTRLAFNGNAELPGSRLEVTIAAAGTYFASVETFSDPGGNPFPYTIRIRSIAPGPGDPVGVRAEGLGLPLGLAAGSNGDLFTGDLAGDRILRVPVMGPTTTFATGIPSPQGLAFDGFGGLLVVSGDGAVYRVSPQGEATRFITDATVPFWVAVGRDGRIWLSDLFDQSIRRYSPAGQFEASFDAAASGGLGPGPLAIGPDGEPYFSNGTEIWKLSNGTPQQVIADQRIIWAIAFDVGGAIYAPMPLAGLVTRFNAAGTPLADPFAVGPEGPQVLAFGRDETGATVARLFAADLVAGRLVELNRAGVERPGLPLGLEVTIEADVAAATLLGGGRLSPAGLLFLDSVGNRNGRYDAGDLQAFLRALGELPGTSRAASPKREVR